MLTGCFTILIPITTIILFYFTNKQAESPSGITGNRYLNAGSMTSGSMLIHCPPLALANLETKVKESESEAAQLCPTLYDPMDTRLLFPWDFLGERTGVGCCFLLQGIFPTEGSNPGLPHGRKMLYRLSHQGTWKQAQGK